MGLAPVAAPAADGPAILLPALLNWITGDAAERAAAARQLALYEEGKDE